MNNLHTAAGLRAWAAGTCATEAAVELLVRCFEGRFAHPGQPWLRYRPGGFWVDTDALYQFRGGLSGGERRVLDVVRVLLTGEPLPDLRDLLAGVDRPHLQLILAALAHAGGSHEDSNLTHGPEGVRWHRLAPLVAWPARSEVA